MTEIEKKIGYAFHNRQLLLTALTHSSLANEKNCESYERLEFLGDSILGYVTAEYLFRQKPAVSEGKMTRMRAELVCEESLHRIAKQLEISEYMRISTGAEKTGMRNLNSVMADMVESVIAAIYLDSGMEEAKAFIYRNLLNYAEQALKNEDGDYKSALQEFVQKNGPAEILYHLESESGPDHNKMFYYSVSVNGENLGKGSGRTKKEAEQASARMALETLREK